MSDHAPPASSPALHHPVLLGNVVLRNRIFMAPMTRNRARPDGVAAKSATTYYTQRASAGLILSEATQISPMGKGYLDTPGIHTDDQVAAWSKIVRAVHELGGRMFLQLWHVGRISHTSLLPGGASPVAPSAIRARARTLVDHGMIEASEPRALSTREIRQIVADYRQAAHRAALAGFDGVELHAAGGYLIDQFLRSGSNARQDEYGGSAKRRVRFLREVTESVLEVWPSAQIGVRISPFGMSNDMHDAEPEHTFGEVVTVLNALGPAYLHVVETALADEGAAARQVALVTELRATWNGLYIANGGYDSARAERAITEGRADAIAFGRLFLANPDLPRRLRFGGPLNDPDPKTLYGGNDRGYIDYPIWAEAPPD